MDSSLFFIPDVTGIKERTTGGRSFLCREVWL